ncbi:MAG: hypothetical protein ACLR6J_19735 [Parabacteroides merdae]
MGALYIKKQLPRRRNALHDTRHIYRPFHRRKQQSPVALIWAGYNGDQMAGELNMEAQHSLEKQTALHVGLLYYRERHHRPASVNNCWTKHRTSSSPNGFGAQLRPVRTKNTTSSVWQPGRDLLNVAEKLLGCPISPDAFLVSTSGRYEYRNKRYRRLY